MCQGLRRHTGRPAAPISCSRDTVVFCVRSVVWLGLMGSATRHLVLGTRSPVLARTLSVSAVISRDCPSCSWFNDVSASKQLLGHSSCKQTSVAGGERGAVSCAVMLMLVPDDSFVACFVMFLSSCCLPSTLFCLTRPPPFSTNCILYKWISANNERASESL